MPRGPDNRGRRGIVQGQRRAARGVLLWGLLLAVGCSATHRIPIEALPGGGTGKARVLTRDGYSYDFERVVVRGDSLIGTYVVVEERIYGRDEIAFVDVERHTVLPLGEVDYIETRHVDIGNSLLLGAGATLFVIWVQSMSAQEETDLGGSSGGKPPPPGGGP